MKNENENKVLLSEERLSELGDSLSDLIYTIKLQNHVINFIPSASSVKGDFLFYYSYVYNTLETFYGSNQKMIRVLEEISFTLQNLSDEKELISLGETITRSFEEGDC